MALTHTRIRRSSVVVQKLNAVNQKKHQVQTDVRKFCPHELLSSFCAQREVKHTETLVQQSSCFQLLLVSQQNHRLEESRSRSGQKWDLGRIFGAHRRMQPS